MANKFLTNIELDAGLKDNSNGLGTSGQVLSSTGTGVSWIDLTSETAERIEVTVKNVSGVQLTKGTLVHAAPTATPPSGNTIEVIAADYDTASAMPAIGVLNETIDDEAEGAAVMMGAVSGIDTDSFNIGDELYVGNNGTFTNTKPATAGQLIQKIAVVIKSHASNGLIKIFGAGRSNDVPLPLYIDNTNQRLGIGNTSPLATLTVGGGTGSLNTSAELFVPNNDALMRTLKIGHGSSVATITTDDSTKPIQFKTGGSERIRILSGGNVGIGTTSPSHKLNIVTANDTTALGIDIGSNAHFDFSANSTSSYTANFNIDDTGLDIGHNSTSRALNLKTGNSDRLTILGTGNVGIGTTSPSSKLHVSGGSSQDIIARFEATGTGTGDYSEIHIANNNNNRLILGSIGSNYSNSSWAGMRYVYSTVGDLGLKAVASDGNVRIYAGGSAAERMRITSTGNVGIGTTSPGNKLHVNGGEIQVVNSSYGKLLLQNSTNYVYGDQNGVAIFNANNNLRLYTVGSERLRIDSSGNVGIGTTSPSYTLDINNDTSTILNLHRPNSSTAAASFLDFTFNTADASSAIYARIRADVETNTDSGQGGDLSFHTANAGTISEVMRITENGQVGIGTTSPSAKLHLQDGDFRITSVFPRIYLQDSNHNSDFSIINGNGNLRFYDDTNTADRLYISAAGNIGIGTTSPGDMLHIHATGNGYKALIVEDDARRIELGRDMIAAKSADGSTVQNLYIQPSGNTAFATNSGNVGIGTTSPTAILDVRGGSSGNNDIDRYVRFKASNGEKRFDFYIGGTGNASILDMYSSDGTTKGVQIASGGTTYFNGGNVGIGTTSPAVKLDVNGVLNLQGGTWNGGGSENDHTIVAAAITEGHFIFTKDGDNLRRLIGKTSDIIEIGQSQTALIDGISFKSGSTPLYRWYSDTAEIMRLNATGLGIGTTSPAVKFEVDSGSSVAAFFKSSANTVPVSLFTTNNAISTIGFKGLGSTSEYHVRVGTNVNDFVAYTNNTEKLRITSSGNVGIGTTSPSQKLHVAGNVTISKSAGDAVLKIEADTDNNNENDNPRIELKQDGGAVYSYYGLNGDINNTFTGAQVNYTYLRASTGLQLVTNGSTTALTIDTSQHATFAGDVTIGDDLLVPKIRLEDINGNVDSLFKIYAWNDELQFTKRNLSTEAHEETLLALDYSDNSAAFAGDVMPSADSTHNIGSNSVRWDTVYADNIDGGNSTLVTSDSSNYFRINTNDGSAQLGLFRTGSNAGGGYIGADSNYIFGAWTSGFARRFEIDNSGNVTFDGTITPGQGYYGNGQNLDYVFARSIYLTTTTSGFLIKTDIASNNYAMLTGTIKLEQFNSNTKQTIEFSATVLNTGSVQSKAGTADKEVTIKLFVYNSVWYVWVPAPSTYTTASAYIETHNSYQGQSRQFNEVNTISVAAVPSSGVSGSVDIVCKFSQGDVVIPGSVTATSLTTNGFIGDTSFNYDTDSGNDPFYISRSGGTGEALSIKVMDNNVRFESIQDESADDYGGFDFRMDSGTTEPDFIIRKGTAAPLFNFRGDGNATFAGTIDSKAITALAKGTQLGTSGYYINSTFKDTGDNVGVFLAHDDTANGVGAIAGINSLAFMTYGSSWEERMRILPYGDIAINRTGQLGTAKLSITADAGEDVFGVQCNSNSTTTKLINIFNSSGTDIASITINNDSTPDMLFNVDDGNSNITEVLKLDSSQNAHFAGDVTVGGDLIVNGTTTTLNTTTVEVEDNILQLNTTQGTPDTATATTSGISIYRGDGVTQASFIFDDADDTWDLTDNLTVRKDVAGSPTRLSISNNGTVQAGTASRLSFYEGTSEKHYIERRRNGSGDLAFVSPADDNPFVFENASGEFLTLTNSKVGINKSSPTGRLHINQTADNQGIIIESGSVQPEIEFRDTVTGDTFSIGHNRANSQLAIEVDGTDKYVFTDGGRLGIGTTSPGAALSAVAADTTVGIFKSTTDQTIIKIEDNDTIGFIGVKDNDIAIGGNSTMTADANFKIDVTTSTAAFGLAPSATDKFRIRQTFNTSDDTSNNGLFIDYNASGTDALTADKNAIALRVDMDSTATGGNPTQELTMYGGYFDVQDTGDANHLYGMYAQAIAEKTASNDNQSTVHAYKGLARAGHEAGQVNQIVGGEFIAQTDNNGGTINELNGVKGLIQNTGDAGIDVGTARAGLFKVDISPSSNDPVYTNVYGVDSEIEMDETTTIGNAFVNFSRLDANEGTITSAYLYRGTYNVHSNATVTNKYGIYLDGSERSYIEGSMNLGGTANYNQGVPLAVKAVAENTAEVLTKIWDGGTFAFSIDRSSTNTDANTELYRLGLNYNNNGVRNGYIGFFRGSDGANGYLTLGTSNTERMRIDSSGNLGIGTTSPNVKVEIKGNTNENVQLRLQTDGGSSEVPTILFRRNSSAYGEIKYMPDGGANQGIHITDYRTDASNIIFNTAGSNERMRIDASGNVGIGTTSPVTKLNVVGNVSVSATKAYRMYNAANNAWGEMSFVEADNRIQFNRGIQNSGTDFRLSEDTNASFVCANEGNLGIGTTNPQTKLHVEGITRVTESSNTAFYGGDYVRVFGNQYYSFRNTGGSTIAQIHMNGNSYFNGGNVGIGTTSPSDGDLTINAPKLHVVGPGTGGTYNLAARFQAGNDSDNTGSAILINHSNDRGLLIKAGRKDGDREVAYFDVISSGGNITNMLTMGKFGSDYNVGIGTISPDKKLHIVDASAGAVTYPLRLQNSGTTVGTDVGLILTTNTSGGAFASSTIRSESEDTSGNCSLVFTTPSGGSTAERMRIDSSGNATFSGNVKVEDSEVHVGDISGDSWTRILHAQADGYGFNWQHDNATVIVNEQGSTNQALVLGDVDAGDQDGLFGIAHKTASTSWAKVLNLKGNGELYIGSAGTSQVYHEGHKPTLTELGAQASGNYITGTGSLSAQDITDIGNLSGTNTGDQDLSGLLPKSGGTMDSDAIITGTDALIIKADTQILFRGDAGSNIASIKTVNTDYDIIELLDNNRMRWRDGMEIYLDDSGITDYMMFTTETSGAGNHALHRFAGYEFQGTGLGNNTIMKLVGTLNAGYVELYHSNAKKFETTSTGVTVTGGIEVGGASSRFTNSVRFTANGTFDDNSKAIFGDDDDLQIYHDGTHSYITENNSGGSLIVRGSNFAVQSSDGTDDFITTVADQGVNLFYNDVKKFETTSTGATVTGYLTVTDSLLATNAVVIGAAGTPEQVAIFEGSTNEMWFQQGTSGGTVRYQTDNFIINGHNGNETQFTSTKDGSVDLYYNNSKKLETTSDGVLVSGFLESKKADTGAGYNDGIARFVNETTATSGGSAVINVRNSYGIGFGGLIKFWSTSTATSVGNISFNSSRTAVNYNTGSDYRLKEDYRDFNALDLTSKIKVYDFKWKNVNDRSYGVIAHELDEIVPSVVSGDKDGEEMQSVDYSKLVPVLIKSIQELEARLAALEN